jgi:hypothetical protein
LDFQVGQMLPQPLATFRWTPGVYNNSAPCSSDAQGRIASNPSFLSQGDLFAFSNWRVDDAELMCSRFPECAGFRFQGPQDSGSVVVSYGNERCANGGGGCAVRGGGPVCTVSSSAMGFRKAPMCRLFNTAPQGCTTDPFHAAGVKARASPAPQLSFDVGTAQLVRGFPKCSSTFLKGYDICAGSTNETVISLSPSEADPAGACAAACCAASATCGAWLAQTTPGSNWCILKVRTTGARAVRRSIPS